MSSNRNNTLVKKWIKYLLLKDTKSKMLFFSTTMAGIYWGQQDFDKTPGMIFAALLVGTILFSFISYLVIGAYREKAVINLYDRIYQDADFPSPYPAKNRDLSKIIVQWRGRKAVAVSIRAAGTSSMIRSTSTWRNVKQSVKDTLPMQGNILFTIFDKHSQGMLVFLPFDESYQLDKEPEVQKWAFDEELYALVYDTLGSYNTPLPVIRSIEQTMDSNDNLLLEKLDINTIVAISKYDKETFENQIRTKYNDPDSLWGFQWGHQDVKVHRIAKDSLEAKQLTMYNALNNLVGNSLRRSFYNSNNEDYAFTPEMIHMNHEGTTISELNINFLDYDLSDESRRDEFEKMTERGLNQLFNSYNWEFNWKIQIFGNSLAIRNLDIS